MGGCGWSRRATPRCSRWKATRSTPRRWAVQLADDQLWQAVEQSLNGAAQHPSWLYKLIDAPSVRVSFQRQTGVEDFPAVTDTSRSPYVQKMLGRHHRISPTAFSG